jgi:hypothetical protein
VMCSGSNATRTPAQHMTHVAWCCRATFSSGSGSVTLVSVAPLHHTDTVLGQQLAPEEWLADTISDLRAVAHFQVLLLLRCWICALP